jgi:glycosyltransferase involved in cell wall biosynthesis
MRRPIRSHLPPFAFGPPPPPPRAHAGPLRILSFGRLLPYKGLDLLVDGLRRLGPRVDLELRVVGAGPESSVLADLRGLPGVTVENRWVPEGEVGDLIAWADALILSHREASQSGAAAAAIAAGRWVVATRVGGLVEQLRESPLARLCDPDPESLAAALHALLDVGSAAVPAAPDTQALWRQAALAVMRDLAPLAGVRFSQTAMAPHKDAW